MWWRRLRLVALPTVLAVGVLASGVAPHAAAQQTDKQRQLQQDIAETSEATEQARAAAAAFRAEKAKYDATLGTLETQLSAAQSNLTAAQAEIDRIAFVGSILTTQVDKTERKLTDAADDAKASAVLLYKRPSNASPIDLIGSADGSGDFVEGKHYLERVSDKRRNDLARAERLRKLLDQQQSELDEQQRQADAAHADADAKAKQIQSLVSQQQDARDGAARAQAGFEAQAAEYDARKTADEGELAAEDARVRELLAAVSNDGPPMGSGQFLRPVGNAPITSPFGYRTDPVTGAQAFHAGIDFGAACGTPIKAAGNGNVVSAGDSGDGYGNAVILAHGGGMATLYGHQSAIAVSKGQGVSAGQVIGYVGSTGKSTGCHLHFEVRVNGNPVNPAGYL